MLSATTALANFLESLGPTQVCPYAELYTFTLAGGEVLRYTTADRDVAWDGVSYSAGTVRFQDPNNRALGHWKIGLDVDEWQVLVTPRSIDPLTGTAWPDTIGDVPFLAAAWAGAFDDAAIEVDYAFFSAPPAPGATTWAPIGTLVWFAGVVVEIDVGQSAAVMTFNDHREKLTLMMPQKLYQAPCNHVLYGPGCGLNPATYATNGAAGAGSTQSAIVTSIGAPAGSATYAQGRIVMTGGQNNGFWRTVRGWGAGVLNLQNPYYWPIAVGDPFTVYAGCDHTKATCTAFGNLGNFGGQPYIPPPELAT